MRERERHGASRKKERPRSPVDAAVPLKRSQRAVRFVAVRHAVVEALTRIKAGADAIASRASGLALGLAKLEPRARQPVRRAGVCVARRRSTLANASGLHVGRDRVLIPGRLDVVRGVELTASKSQGEKCVAHRFTYGKADSGRCHHPWAVTQNLSGDATFLAAPVETMEG